MRLFVQLVIIFLLSVPTSAYAELSLPPHTSGLMLAKVVNVTRSDSRPMDGNLMEIVKVNIEKSTGCVSDSFGIVVDYGGLRPAGSPTPVWNGPPPGTFKEGEKYWIAVTSNPEYEICSSEIIGWWNSGDKKVESEFESTVQQNLLQKRPHYSPETGVSINHDMDAADKISGEALKERNILQKK